MRKPNLVIRMDGTFSKQEPSVNIGDPETFAIVGFEKNPLYDKYHFISSYPLTEDKFKEFVITGNIGEGHEEKKAKAASMAKIKAQLEIARAKENLFYNSLPLDARIRNKDLRDAEALQQKVKADPDFPLTEKESNLLQRAEKYRKYKDQFY